MSIIGVGDPTLDKLLGSLQDRISALEDQIASVASSQQSMPNYLSVDPVTKLVTATFAGIIAAQGVSLPEAVGAQGPKNLVEWLTAANTIAETLFGVNAAGLHELFIQAGNSDTTIGASVIARAWKGIGANNNMIDMRLIDHLQNSDFVQASPGPRQSAMNWGLSGPKTGGALTTFSVTHGLVDKLGNALTPTSAVVIPLAFACRIWIIALGNTSVQFACDQAAAANQFFWFAAV